MRTPLLALAAVAAVAAGCGSDGAQSAGTLPAPTDPPAATDLPATGGATTPGSVPGDVVELSDKPLRYALEAWFTDGDALRMVRRLVRLDTPTVGSAAMAELLRGPSPAERDAGIGTAVPAGTELLGLDIDGGTATVDLSGEFETGGGSLSVTARLAQVVYTLTQFPTVREVAFRLDGEPVNVFSGEGIVLDRPLRRGDYRDLAPAITVADPAVAERITSPVTVRGTADVFEANVTVILLDGAGRELARDFTSATCGTGCRGTYVIRLPFAADAEGPGTLVVQDDDADGDGAPSHQVRVPVTLAPAG